jgi:hypothetical protein
MSNKIETIQYVKKRFFVHLEESFNKISRSVVISRDSLRYSVVFFIVVDWNRFDSEPDPTFHFDADPELDPDPSVYPKF